MFRRLFAASVALVCLAFAEGMPPASSDIPITGTSNGIQASREFCTRSPKECAIDRSEAKRIVMTPATFALIERINVAVNDEITPITDKDHWGVIDRWDFPEDGSGDCEDMQLEKRRRLVEAGLPHRALRMAVVLDHSGDGHAVLIVHTTQGDYVLDNMTPAVLGWAATRLIFIQREGSDGGWVKLDEARPNS